MSSDSFAKIYNHDRDRPKFLVAAKKVRTKSLLEFSSSKKDLSVTAWNHHFVLLYLSPDHLERTLSRLAECWSSGWPPDCGTRILKIRSIFIWRKKLWARCAIMALRTFKSTIKKALYWSIRNFWSWSEGRGKIFINDLEPSMSWLFKEFPTCISLRAWSLLNSLLRCSLL